MRYWLCLSVQLFLYNQVFSQAVFEGGDFATLTDSFIVSNIGLLAIPGYDYDTTGAGITWDYSSFEPVSQKHKKFTDPDFTGFRTAFFFSCSSSCYDNCYANCVNSGTFPLVCAGSCNVSCGSTCLSKWMTQFDLAELANDSINLIITSIQDIYNFYDFSPEALSQIAAGAKLSGFPIVIEYQNADRVYSFPLQYGKRDTSFSNYSLHLDSIPGTGIALSFVYNHRQQRYNHVDGWGTLKTPFGVFDNVIKMKTIINTQDTVVADNSTYPLNFLPQSVIEYKWFSPDYGIPLLKVIARVINGNVVYQDLEYIDSLRCFDPAAIFGYQPFPTVINQDEDSVTVSFYSLSINGDRFTWDFGDTASLQNTATGANASHAYTEGGLYTVNLTACNTACSSHLCDVFSLPVLIIDLSEDTSTAINSYQEIDIAVSPNPFHDYLLINVNSHKNENLKLAVYDELGKEVLEAVSQGQRTIRMDVRALHPGFYLMAAETESARKFYKLTKLKD